MEKREVWDWQFLRVEEGVEVCDRHAVHGGQHAIADFNGSC